MAKSYYQLNVSIDHDLRQRIFQEAEQRKLSIRALIEAGLDAMALIDNLRIHGLQITQEEK